MKRAERENFMREAIRLARRGLGMTSPNPAVGAVVVKDNQIIGRGFHERAGGAHAEVAALTAAGPLAEGADIFVTLEPCSTHGRTPPCVDAIIEAGIKRAFIGCLDPNPKHAGGGIGILKSAGIEVEYDIMRAECHGLNESFNHWITTGRPFVILKMAQTLDGRIATARGESKWITGAQARARVQELRRWADAIAVGAGTARTDFPSLTVRDPDNWPRQPRRLVWSRSLTVAGAADLLGAGPLPELVSADDRWEWHQLLTRLGCEEVTALLLEGGGLLAASALRSGAVNRVELHIATKIIGGDKARPSFGGADIESLADAIRLHDIEIKRLGEDISVTGRPVVPPERSG